MAITVDWPAGIINVPKADLQLVQASPAEILQLDLEGFRKTLRDLEDDEDGRPWPRTHNYSPPATLGGVTLAALIEITSAYTVTFEPGAYQVDLVGTNSNVADRTNPNGVGVRSANSAGLTYSKQVEDQSFTDARVWIDVDAGRSGTEFPRGTPGDPVDNLVDARAIIESRRFPKRLQLRGALSVGAADDISNFDILGASAILASLDVADGASTDNLVVEALTIMGDLSGNLTARSSTSLSGLDDFEGTMSDSGIEGVINVADGATVQLNNCFSEVAGLSTPVINMGANSTLMLRNYSGGVEVRGMTAGCVASVDLDPGTLTLDNSNVGGSLWVRGTGVVNDDSAGTFVAKDSLVKADELDLLFYDRQVSFDSTRGTTGLTNFPAGTSGRPVATEADARLIADAIGVRQYQILGVLTLTQAHKEWRFDGNGGSTARVNLGGQDVAGAKFQSLNVQGEMVAETGIVEVRNGPFGNISGLRGTVVECGVFGTITFGTAPNTNRFVRCQQGNSAPTFDCTNIAAGGGIIFAIWDGLMTLTNLSAGAITIDGLGAEVSIDASCTGGTIIVRGMGQIDDNSGPGCTVIVADSIAAGEYDKLVVAAVAGRTDVVDGPAGTKEATFFAEDGITPLRTVRFDEDNRIVL